MSRQFMAVISLTVAAFAGICLYTERMASWNPSTEKLATPQRLPVPENAKKATFAGGCFWGVEETFRTIPGVVDTRAGYSGGTSASPTYETVHHDTTGHVEAVEVTFDPQKISYEQLLTVYFTKHDVTRPGIRDTAMGKQYRSFIFTHDAAQAKTAHHVLNSFARNGKYSGAPRPIATAIQPTTTFWPAEEYHQRYYEKRGMASSCQL